MGKCMFLSTGTPVKICQRILPYNYPTVAKNLNANSIGFGRKLSYRTLCTKSALPEVSEKQQFFKIAADSTGSIPPDQLMQAVESAAKAGAQVGNLFIPRPLFFQL